MVLTIVVLRIAPSLSVHEEPSEVKLLVTVLINDQIIPHLSIVAAE